MSDLHMTTAAAIVRFLDNQYVVFDGVETKFVDGIAALFGHGNVVGLGAALYEDRGALHLYQGKNEQGMAHMAAAFAKQNNRRKIIACTSSIGPGAANMVTAAACASVNNIPLLLFPGDAFATRQPDPVLQQVELENCLSTTTNDAFRAVCRFFERISRPEQIMTALINAMRVLTDPVKTGAVCIALPQDVEGESCDFPEYFFRKRVHRITRPLPDDAEISDAARMIAASKKPLVICGGGVRYSEAGEELEKFCETFRIPFGETQAGKSACRSGCELCLGGIGATGNLAANTIAAGADLVISVGSRLSDFTTASKSLFSPSAKILSLNISRYHAEKMDAAAVVGDAKASLSILTERLAEINYVSGYKSEIKIAKAAWEKEMKRLSDYSFDPFFEPLIKAGYPGSIREFAKMTGTTVTQTSAICELRRLIPADAIIVGASGSLPGCLQRMWTTDTRYAYHMEYGYSCMGYEIAGALGAKLAAPDREVYAMVGDGSFLMLHSELLTSLQERKKITVLLFDNGGFGCINNLQMSNGIGNLATEFRYRDQSGELLGDFMPVDYAAVAAGYGCKTYTVRNLAELEEAVSDSRKQTFTTLIDIKTLPKTMTDGYKSWWHVGVASTSGKEAIRSAYEVKETALKNARKY